MAKAYQKLVKLIYKCRQCGEVFCRESWLEGFDEMVAENVIYALHDCDAVDARGVCDLIGGSDAGN